MDHDRGWRAAIRHLVTAPRRWRSPVNHAVVDLVAPQPGESILDIGAGMGPATVLVARRGAEVTALDPTPVMRRMLATRRLFQAARPRISVSGATAEHLPFPDASFDAALSVNSMHHWSNVDTAIRELARVVKPGGRVVLVEEDFQDDSHPRFERMQHRHDHGHGGELGPVDFDAVGAMLTETGFSDVEAATDVLAGLPCRIARGIR